MSIEIKAVKRDVKGTGASRRLRRAGSVPGVVYGAGKDAVNIELNTKELFLQFRHEAFHASILSLNLDGKKEDVLLRDFQMHPVRNSIQHMDFQRVNANEKVHVKIPFHFLHEDTAPGVKVGGGIVAHIMTEAEVSCLPKDLPEFIEVDLAALELGDSVHLSQITLPKGVEFVALAHGNDAAVAAIAKTRGGVSDDAGDGETPAADAPAAPADDKAAE
jgi:large subunit ribosomal protein L25